MAGLLDTFTTAKRGLMVQQSSINTASHNIANTNTVGYSRQRSVSETTRPFGGMSKFDTCTVGQVGTGAEVTSIQRIRDLFLDYQVRSKTTENETQSTKYEYLYQVEDILNDSSDAGVQNALNEFFDAFQELAKAPEKTSNRDVAISQAATLADMINSKYNQIESKKSDAQTLLSDNVIEINNILDSINNLNKQISEVSAVGMTPNDLMDKRDSLLDELSGKFGITIDRDKRETINLTSSEYNGNVKTINEDGTTITTNKIVSSNPNDQYMRFSYIKDVQMSDDKTKLTVTYNQLGDTNKTKTVTISCNPDDANNIKNDLLESRVLIGDQEGIVRDSAGKDFSESSTISYNDFKKSLFNSDTGVTKGEIAGNHSAQESIQKSMNELDKLAIGLAYTVNAIQTGSLDGNDSLKYSDGTTDAELIFVVKKDDGTVTSTDNGITAKNITINTNIKNDSSKLIGGDNVSEVSGDKAGTRALAIANLSTLKIDYSTFEIEDITRDKFFNGDLSNYSGTGIKFTDDTDNTTRVDLSTDKAGSTIKDYYVSVTSNLGIEIKSINDELTTSSEILDSLKEQRLSVSGVSLDEEMTNLITFQHAYQANAKIINTVNQLLDVVINGLV